MTKKSTYGGNKITMADSVGSLEASHHHINMQLTISGEKEVPANDEGGTTGTTSRPPSAPYDLSIAEMEQCVKRVKAEYFILRDAGMSQCREAQLKVIHGEEDAAMAAKRAMEVLQRQEDILKRAHSMMDVLIALYQRAIAVNANLLRGNAKEGAAETQAIKARRDEAH